MIECRTCGIEKSFEDYPRNKSKKNGRETACNECARIKAAKWYVENHERGLETRRKYYTENTEFCIASSKQWRLDNPEQKAANDRQWREANPERKASNDRQWVLANREASRKYKLIYQRKRLAIIKASGWVMTDEFVNAMKIAQNNECNLCKTDITLKYHTDHIHPLSRDGKHTPQNIQVLCPLCNLRKSTMLMTELVERASFRSSCHR